MKDVEDMIHPAFVQVEGLEDERVNSAVHRSVQ